jgi:hypothetical protein
MLGVAISFPMFLPHLLLIFFLLFILLLLLLLRLHQRGLLSDRRQ